jgi:HAD superfamily hydrolase (TIGR01509 family)
MQLLITDQTFDAIIFDHDGTLVDTESPDFLACKMLFDEFGVPLTLEGWAAKAVGVTDGYNDLFQDVIQNRNDGISQADLWRRLQELWKITYEQVELMPGVNRLIPELEQTGYRLGVATASNRQWADRWLAHFDLLPYFQVIATSDDVVHNKPAPDVYLYAATELGVPPERCLAFEDSVAGVQAAKAAGMTAIAVPSHVTKSLDFSQADGTVWGLDNVTIAWIKELDRVLQRENRR